MYNINEIDRKITDAGFELYLSSKNFEPEIWHEIYTCIDGEYSGEVIDVRYNFITGEVLDIEYSTQFKGQSPKFSI